MKVWVDADACPGIIKEIIIRAAVRLKVECVFVANKNTHLPASPYLSSVRVELGADKADQYICEQANNTDLVITQDILLASLLVPKGITVIDPRGDDYTAANIDERVSRRALMNELRDSGDITGGPKQLGEKDKRHFANAFDRALTRLLR